MSKKQKIYCKIGQAVCEGVGCLAMAGIFATMFLIWFVS